MKHLKLQIYQGQFVTTAEHRILDLNKCNPYMPLSFQLCSLLK